MHVVKTCAIAVVAFAGGILVANMPSAFATAAPDVDLSKREFSVYIDEVKENIVFGESFVGSYSKSVTLSDGSVREITLTPMVHRGMQVVEFHDTGGKTYMGLGGTTTNGNLMVQVQDNAALAEAQKAQGWK